MRYVAFDIEIAKLLTNVDDWKTDRPLGISCAATLTSDEDEPRLWYSTPLEPEESFYSSIMNEVDVQELVHYLRDKSFGEGYMILTFNGLGFDFDILSEESGLRDDCKALASNHIDMFWHIFCLQGYCPGLGAIAKGLGLAGKTEGINGALAPEMWQKGEYDKVLEYVAQDVRTTLEIAQFVDAWGSIQWTSKAGRPKSLEIGNWLTVKEAMVLPEPDISWMTNAWPRSKFVGWLE